MIPHWPISVSNFCLKVSLQVVLSQCFFDILTGTPKTQGVLKAPPTCPLKFQTNTSLAVYMTKVGIFVPLEVL